MSENLSTSIAKNTRFEARDALQHMDTAAWGSKAVRWAKQNPTIVRGVEGRLSNKTEFGPDDVELDADGNITNMPLLVGKPCFGIPTAFLRHGGKQPNYVHRQKKWQPSRCMKCKVQAACKKVCFARIALTPDIKGAIDDWQEKGGRKGLRTPVKYPKCEVAMEKIARLTKAHIFTSSNDEPLRAHYEQKRIDFLEKDKLRKRRARAKAIRDGKLDDDVLDYFRRCRFVRLNSLKEECAKNALPPKLRHLGEQGMINTADVFLEKIILQAEQSAVNPSAIGKRLIEKDKANRLSHNVLRARVAKDLRRIDFLESTRSSASSGKIWPKFNVKQELVDYTKRMID